MNNHAVASVNAILDDFFQRSIKEAGDIDPSYQQLWQRLHDLISAGGKRLRPQMVLLSYDAFGGDAPTSILPIAAAQELLHFSLLIHDDIIDRDYTRYGTANIAGQYTSLYHDFVSNKHEVIHYAHSAALLAGDLMLSAAHQMIAESSLPASTIATVQQLFHRGIFEVVGGELLDTELSFMPYNDGDALTVARYKTAGYSFVAPLVTGARLADASDEQCQLLRECAIGLGIAYQLTDDLLGVFGEEDTTGKSTTSDITEGKRTYMVEVALRALSDSETAAFMQGFGNQSATAEEIATVKSLLVSSGARQQVKATIARYTATAIDCLSSLDLPAHHHQQFLDLIETLTHRDV